MRTEAPNFLWIMADELRTDALGCYGGRDPRLQTPAIDRVARSGTLFEQCFTASPVCVPARAAMLTGQSPLRTGILDNEAYDQPATLSATFPELLAEAGWRTTNLGKEHLPGAAVPWQHHDEHGSHMPDVLADARAARSDIRRAPGINHVYSAPLPEGADFSSDAVTHNAITAIREARDPFLIRASYLQPHRPAVVPEPWASRYSGITFDVDAEETAAANEFERQFGRVSRGSELPDSELNLALQMYYGSASWFDSQVAAIMQQLEASELLDSTVVIINTDHGAIVGDAGGFGKHTFAVASHRVPLIISIPGERQGRRRSDLATSEDLCATVLALAGVAAPAMDGRDLFSDPSPSSIRSAIGYGETWSRAFPNRDAGRWTDGRGWPQRICVRRQGLRLDANARINGVRADLRGPDADLFLADSRRDPDERRNLVYDERYADILASMLRELDAVQLSLEQAPTLESRGTPRNGFAPV